MHRFNDSLVKAGTGDDSAKDGEAGGDMIVLDRKEALAADLIDDLRVPDLDDGRVGRAKPAGEMGRHVRITRS